MRFEKKCNESCSFNEAGEKDIKLTYDANIVMSIEEAEEVLACIQAIHVRNETVMDLYETLQKAKEYANQTNS